MDIENIPEPEYSSDSEHPTPEQLFLRMAVKHLTPKQRKVWDYHNFDRLTQDEIGAKLGITHQAVADHISACEARIAKWCKNNMDAYTVLKQELEVYSEAPDRANGMREYRDAKHKTPVRRSEYED